MSIAREQSGQMWEYSTVKKWPRNILQYQKEGGSEKNSSLVKLLEPVFGAKSMPISI